MWVARGSLRGTLMSSGADQKIQQSFFGPFVLGRMLTLPVAVTLAGLISLDRPVETFHALSISGGLEAHVKRGGKPKLTLRGEPEDVAKVDAAVKDGRLVLGPKPGTWRMGKVVADVTLP